MREAIEILGEWPRAWDEAVAALMAHALHAEVDGFMAYPAVSRQKFADALRGREEILRRRREFDDAQRVVDQLEGGEAQHLHPAARSATGRAAPAPVYVSCQRAAGEECLCQRGADGEMCAFHEDVPA